MEFAHNIFRNERLRHWSFFSFAAQDPEETIAAQKTAPVRAASRTRPLRILLVEDHGDTARVMQQLLRLDRHEVIVAGDVCEIHESGAVHAHKILRGQDVGPRFQAAAWWLFASRLSLAAFLLTSRISHSLISIDGANR